MPDMHVDDFQDRSSNQCQSNSQRSFNKHSWLTANTSSRTKNCVDLRKTEFEKLKYLVNRAVRIQASQAAWEELEELRQEGLLALWGTLRGANTFDENIHRRANTHIHTRIKNLRRQQTSKQITRDTFAHTLPEEDAINWSLNASAIQKALAELEPEECYAIVADFGVTNVQVKNFSNLSPSTKKRRKKSGLVSLANNKTLQSLVPHRFAS